uniref:CCR4-NOT transcription complex subunit 1-like n=1 Tax=Saccoglossus kowalevskii TaxID=10224 RepID=A0ABM0M0W0_SACKO|nr:PREDICTED: CCR4-NOT transcription complex subunit 1-like [Saccoglossus kowalevskii]
MNLDSLSLALSQISYSVANLTKKNYKSSVADISRLVSQHGPEADRHLFRCLFSHVDFSGDGRSSGKDFHQFLIQECATLITKPNFISTLCYAVDNPLHHQKSLKASTQLFPQLSKVLKLTRVQEVVFGIALQHSTNRDTRTYAAQFAKQKLPDLLRSYIDSDISSNQEGGLNDIAVEVLHLLLTHLLHGPKDHSGIGTDQKEAFLNTLKRDFPRHQVPVVLAPLLYSEKQDVTMDRLIGNVVNVPKAMMDGSLADTLLEIGYGCCATVEECRNTLVQFGVNCITPISVAKVLGMMARTHTGLADQMSLQSLTAPGGNIWSDGKDKGDQGNQINTWNVDIFVEVAKDLAPHINWKEVIFELDHPGFHLKDAQALRLIKLAYMRGLQELFPVEFIYRTWKNREGQLSWIQQALNNPEIFCFADYPCHTAVTDILKAPPDDENREIATWKSLDLVETLLRLSETGKYDQVKSLFTFPIKNCPDVLLLALLQAQPTWNTLRHELVSTLLPIFLGSHPNSAIVLHYAWHGQGQSPTIRQLVMHAMAEWYIRGDNFDQTRLSRILDVAQDLKALSMLLNGTPFAFVIDLACLASRREYLKLDKWLSDKIREHGEPFIQACVTFLKRRAPQVLGGGLLDKSDISKAGQLPPETIGTMLACLQACVGNVQQDISETILTMVGNSSHLLKSRQPPGVITKNPVSSSLPGFPGIGTQGTGSQVLGTQGLGTQGFGSQGLGTQGHGSQGLGTQSLGTQGLGTQGLGTQGLGTQGLGTQGLVTQGLGSQIDPLANSISSLSLGTTTPTSTMSGFPSHLGSPLNAPQSPQKQFPNLTGTSGLSSMAPLSQMQANFGGGSGGGGGFGNAMMNAGSTDLFKQSRTPASLGALNPSAAQAFDQAGTKTTSPALRPGELEPKNFSSDLSNIWPEMNQTFSKDIDDEANSYFQKIYNQHPEPTMSVDEVLDMLKRFKDSPVKKEREVFLCMLRNLFEEYRFFPQYPDRELHITACLFGGIVEQGLVTYMALGIALRYVLEALRKQHGSKMYYFGISSLDRFKTRLKDYPQYCQHLASIPHFSQFPEILIEYVQYGQQSREPPVRLSTQTSSIPPISTPTILPVMAKTTAVTTTTTTTTVATTTTKASTKTTSAVKGTREVPPSIANTTNIDTLLTNTPEDEQLEPPESIQDKVFFIFNNLSQSNLQPKCDELKDLIGEEYLPWVSQYLVQKRASIEPNFHMLYSNFMDVLKHNKFCEMVLKETYRNIKVVLLNSNKSSANFSDRTILKNLGHWLGMLTVYKNKPILQIDLDLKSLLLEAYHKGQQEMLYVVPFVAKVLESCAKSRVFKPPNPWTMGIMNALAEMHTEQDLKLNLKFEIEVLCKTLNLDINDLAPGTLLQDTERLIALEEQIFSPVIKVEENLPASTTTTTTSSADTTTVAATTTSTTTTATPVPPQPQFSFHDLNVSSLAGLAPHIAINNQIALFQANLTLKQCVRPSVDRAVQELVTPVVERSIKIAMTTCEQIVKKDFALDPEESRMRAAAHHMVRNLTAGMAMITCREPLMVSISNNFKNNCLTALKGATTQQKEMIEQAATVVATENVELACAFIQKCAVEKAVPEMDKRLATEFELRKHARNEGRRYCDPMVLTYQAERMPEQIRLKVGGVTLNQTAVYEEFARNIPGFLPTNDASQPTGFLAKPMQVTDKSYATDEITQIYDKCAGDIEQYLQCTVATPNNPLLSAIHSLLEAVLLARNSREIVTALALLQKAVEGLLEGLNPQIATDPELSMRFRDCHLLVLKALQDHRAYGPQWTNKQVTRVLCETRTECRYNLDAVDCLIRNHLVNLQAYDMHLAQSLENGLNFLAVAFAMQLVKYYLIDEKMSNVCNEADLFNTLQTLVRIASHSANPPEGLTQLVDVIRQNHDTTFLDKAPGGPTSMMHSGISQAREFDDPPGLREKTEYLLREWVNMYHSPAAGRDSTKAFSAFVGQMHQQGILKTDDLITRFFRLCTEMCVELCYRALAEQSSHSPTLIRAKCFHTLDAFVRLIALLVKHSGDATNTVTKINLLNKVLGIVAGVLLQDHEVRHTEFQQLPYHRIFIMLLLELNAPEHVLESINYQVLTAFCNAFHVLRPSKAPGFAYSWLELISHRIFIARMLAILPQQKGWPMYAQLLIDLFKFLAPFLRNAELAKHTTLLYKGTLRVLLVLLHDFPEFLCDYHYGFCDVIPPNCIQMRNLILSAFPRNMRLPDPFTPNLKVDMLNEITHPPRILTNFAAMIQPSSFKKDLDSYLKTRSPVTFLSELRGHLQVSNDPGIRYNIPLTNALVLYVGSQAIAYIHSKGSAPSMSTITHSSHMDIFQNLAVDLDTEGRYLFLNAIANQLRYPNSHTHYFSCTLLYLFAEANTEAIQEQITRVLLERLIVNRPHPWGLLITFIELIKNPNFKFWNHEFVHCAPEIEK